MSDFIVFKRTAGHCYVERIPADSLIDALQKYLAYDLEASPVPDSARVELDGKCYHCLELVEFWHKANSKYDELELDSAGVLLNHQSWQINEAGYPADKHGVVPLLCSYEPSSIANYIELCRGIFRKAHPRSRARAFVWYLRHGPLVTFYRNRDPNLDKPLEIAARYLIRWQKDKYPQPYSLTPEMIEEWPGTYDDILEQLVQ